MALLCDVLLCLALITGPTHRIETQGLNLVNVGRNDSGWYRCQAENGLGSASMTARIRVEGKYTCCPFFYSVLYM